MSEVENSVWYQIHHGEAPIVDMHVHPSLKTFLFKRVLTMRAGAHRAFNPFSLRTDFGRLAEGGVDVVLSAAYAPEHDIIRDCFYLRVLRFVLPITYLNIFRKDYLPVTLHILDVMEEQVRRAHEQGKARVQMARSVRELDAILAQGPKRPIAVVHSVEGAHSLDGKIESLHRLFERGVAYLTLAHFYENPAVAPVFPYPESVQGLRCFQYGPDLTRGLTSFGEEVVEAMVDMGMIIDVCHCTPSARARIYDIVGKRRPIIASHVGAYEINPSPYNLKDWEIKRIADTGGLSAVILMNYWLMAHETKRGLNFIARTIDHFARVGGIDHVGIGTDYDGFTDPPDEVKDASELPRLTQRLLAEGFSRTAIEKVWGGNAIRVLHDGWGR
ncbi:MAG: membrane dipeptidase [Anaerolineae bacterium]|nr:membrane dipeptidase [Anaerolineae bacterium]